MTPERKVKAKVSKLLKERGAYHFYPVASMYGSAGIPDIIACYQGKFIGIECKAGKGKTTALQEHNLQQIRDAGGISLVVYEDLTELIAVLDVITKPSVTM
jgi:Holliday junction resolvase